MQLESNENLVKYIILSEKYSNFSNRFDKTKVDKLLEHLYHNLAIKLIENRQSPFESSYTFFRTELELIYKYINKIFDIKFIKPFKSLSDALVFFMPKLMVCAYA